MSNAIRGKNRTWALGMGIRVAAVAAAVGLVTLAAGRGHVLPDERVAEQAAVVAAAPALTSARMESSVASFAFESAARDPSLPAEADVMPSAKDEPAAPTF